MIDIIHRNVLFWKGLTQYRLGDPSTAETFWIECTELDLPEGDQGSPVELIMAFYYLGDKERHGLELLLHTYLKRVGRITLDDSLFAGHGMGASW